MYQTILTEVLVRYKSIQDWTPWS